MSPAIAIGVVLTAILLVLGICRNLSFGAGTSHALDLPDTPFGPARADPCDASPSCEQRALVLATRAEELLVMPGSGASEQVRAAVLLARASGMLKNSADKKALDLDRRAQELEHRIVTDYRRELLALRRAVESGNSAAAAAAAGRILGFGVGFDSATRARLEKIARGEL